LRKLSLSLIADSSLNEWIYAYMHCLLLLMLIIHDELLMVRRFTVDGVDISFMLDNLYITALD